MVESRSFFLKFLHLLFVCFAYIFLYLPIFVLSIFSFNISKVPSHWEGFSLKWYKALLTHTEILESFKVSIIVALCATLLSVLLGTCFVVASKWWKSDFLFYLFYANILLPEIVLGIGILSTFALLKIPLGYGSLIVGHTILGFGFVIPIIKARFVELDPLLTEASLDLGANHVQTFTKVTLPLLMPSLIASSLLVFTLSLDDFLISFFCSGPSVQTLSVCVYSMAKLGVNPTINAVSTIFLVISSIVVFFLCYSKVIDQVVSQE
jgi:spermidine/putrescine transport system permease protein